MFRGRPNLRVDGAQCCVVWLASGDQTAGVPVGKRYAVRQLQERRSLVAETERHRRLPSARKHFS